DARRGRVARVEAARIRVEQQERATVLQHIEATRGGLQRAVQLVDLLVESAAEQRRGVGDPDVARGEVDILYGEARVQGGERERGSGDSEDRRRGDDAARRQGTPLQRSPSWWSRAPFAPVAGRGQASTGDVTDLLPHYGERCPSHPSRLSTMECPRRGRTYRCSTDRRCRNCCTAESRRSRRRCRLLDRRSQSSCRD